MVYGSTGPHHMGNVDSRVPPQNILTAFWGDSHAHSSLRSAAVCHPMGVESRYSSPELAL